LGRTDTETPPEGLGELHYNSGGRPKKNRGREILLLVELGFSREQIAEATGLKKSSLRVYFSRLRKKHGETVNKTVNKTPPKCQCGSERVRFDPENGELVCCKCGLVLFSEQDFDIRLPFDTTYALESDLAVGKSLGGSLPKKNLYQILARSDNGSEDLGIRARQIRVLAETNEPPSLAKMLKKAYETSKRFNLEGDKLFNNDLGRNVRRAFWLARELEININGASETAFWVTLCQHGKQKLIPEVENSLKINQTLLGLTLKLNHFLLTVKKEFQVTSSPDATQLV